MVGNEMSVPVFGFLCVLVFAVVMIAAVVGVAVMVASLADRRVWDGVAWLAKAAVPVVAIGFVLLLLFGTSVRVVSHQGAVEQAHPVIMHESIPTSSSVPAQGDLERPSDVPDALSPSNDLRPIDPLSAAIPANERATESVATSTPIPVRPAWVPEKVEQQDKLEGDNRLVVIPSALFATEQEAESSLDPMIYSIVKADFLRMVRHTTLQPRRMPLLTHMVSNVVTDRYVQVETRDLGAVTAPMYRVWKRIELSPRSRTQFLNVYHAQISEARAIVAGAIFLGLLAIPAAVLLCYRGLRWTHGRGQRLWAVSAVATVLLLWTAAAMWLNQYVTLV